MELAGRLDKCQTSGRKAGKRQQIQIKRSLSLQGRKSEEWKGVFRQEKPLSFFYILGF